jgi:hypothetical protein
MPQAEAQRHFLHRHPQLSRRRSAISTSAIRVVHILVATRECAGTPKARPPRERRNQKIQRRNLSSRIPRYKFG